MIKQNKLKTLISSLIILLPAITVAVFYKGAIEKSLFTVMCIASGIMLVVHWLGLIITAKDKRNKDQSPKVLGLLFWICPMIAVMTSAISAAIIIGIDFKMSYILGPIIALVMIIFGNYLPKCKQNFFIGLRLPWTLANEENWNVTHRLAGKLWVGGGALIAVFVFLPDIIFLFFMIGVVLVASVVPSVYSYVYYKKQLNNGSYKDTEKIESIKEKNKKYLLITLVISVITAAFLIFISFTGKVVVEFGDDSLTVTSTYYSDLVIEYCDIESAELRESVKAGTKVAGFNSPKVLLGSFKNEEFGNYSRYTNTKYNTCIVLTVNGETIVINGEGDEATRLIYEKLIEKGVVVCPQ
jgi:uncharacterized membrane protein